MNTCIPHKVNSKLINAVVTRIQKSGNAIAGPEYPLLTLTGAGFQTAQRSSGTDAKPRRPVPRWRAVSSEVALGIRFSRFGKLSMCLIQMCGSMA